MKSKAKRSIRIDRIGRSVDRAPSIAALIFSSADTDIGRSMLQALSTCDYATIVSAGIDPRTYTNADTFGRDYLCVELMSKYPNWELGLDRAEVALAKFRESELTCRESNSRLSSGSLFRGGFMSLPGTYVRSVIETARRKIERLLGPFSWDEASRYFDWGPGASTSLSRRHGDAYYKFSASVLDASGNTASLVEALRLWRPLWAFDVNYVAGNKLTTVPKNAKTDRVIAIEPDLNMFFQKGIGGVIRRRLNRVGLLWPDAQERNSALARVGSVDGSVSTIDLSSASDTVSLELVRSLLPVDWVEAIEHCRSPRCVLPSGEVILLEKVSSMGNGFTFELETLVFWSLARAVAELHGGSDRRLLVYGDDIIVPTDVAHPLIDLLMAVGFSVNSKKTFVDGPFRESCGKHWFNGTDVTPFYFRKPIDSVSRSFVAANAVERYSRMSWGRDSRWRVPYIAIVDSLPAWARKLRIPDGAPEDSGLVSDFDDARPRVSAARPRTRGWCGYTYRHLSPRSAPLGKNGVGRLLKGLHSLEKRHRLDGECPSYLGKRIVDIDFDVLKSSRQVIVESNVFEWSSFGPWM